MKFRPAHLPVYPFLVASLPLMDFALGNFWILGPGDGWRLLALYFLLTGLALFVGRLIWGQTARAALVVTPALLVLFWGSKLGVAASVWVLVITCGLGVLLRLKPFDANRLNLPLNMAVLVFLAVPAARIARAEWRAQPPAPTALAQEVPQLSVATGTVPPDIYFLLVDGLGQPDFLREQYGLAAADFREVLQHRGFQVLAGSQSVYPQTALSTASTLNMDFLQNLLQVPDPQSLDRRVLGRLVAHNRVTAALRGVGYTVAAFPSGFPVTRLAGSRRRFQPRWNLSFLEYYLLDQTVLPLLGGTDILFAVRRQRLEYIFDELPQARRGMTNEQPLFVFAHILAPHPPFVFDRDGTARAPGIRFGFADGSHWRFAHHSGPAAYRQAYAGQAAYVLRRLAEAIDKIVAQSPRPPLIIIQGDHGPGSELEWEDARATNTAERFGIGNAWLVPPGMELALPQDATSVNTFRRLFDGIFGTELGLLPPQRWFAPSSHPYSFVDLDSLDN